MHESICRLRRYEGNTALHVAAVSGNDDGCKLLVSAGADVDARNLRGETALHMAASGGHMSNVDVLLRLGADPTVVDDSDRRYTDVLPELSSSQTVSGITQQSSVEVDTDGQMKTGVGGRGRAEYSGSVVGWPELADVRDVDDGSGTGA